MYCFLKKWWPIFVYIAWIPFVNAMELAKIEEIKLPGARDFWLAYYNECNNKNEALEMHIYFFIGRLYKHLSIELDQNYHREFSKHINSPLNALGHAIKAPDPTTWPGKLQYHFLYHIVSNLSEFTNHDSNDLPDLGRNIVKIDWFEKFVYIFGDIIDGDNQYLNKFETFFMQNLKWFRGRDGDSAFGRDSEEGSFTLRYSSKVGKLTLCICEGIDTKTNKPIITYYRISKINENEWVLEEMYSAKTLRSLILDLKNGNIFETLPALKNLVGPKTPKVPQWYWNYEALYAEYEIKEFKELLVLFLQFLQERCPAVKGKEPKI